jgi:(p)ppGpp synthase/HD superfamily hydrolase
MPVLLRAINDQAGVDFTYGANHMERDVLQKRIARLTTLKNVGGVFRDGLATYLRARAFAIKAHLGQMHGNSFYTCHLEEVEKVLIRFDYCSFRIRATAWLHDTVEKFHVTTSDINREFPGLVASTVDAVTTAPGKTREERNSATYARIKEGGRIALVLKLADRIANLEETILAGGDRLCTYEEEHSEFREALYEPGKADAMWEHLDTLIELRIEALNRQTLTAFANGVSSSNTPSKLQIEPSVSHPSSE